MVDKISNSAGVKNMAASKHRLQLTANQETRRSSRVACANLFGGRIDYACHVERETPVFGPAKKDIEAAGVFRTVSKRPENGR
jgi:hypothetical protein